MTWQFNSGLNLRKDFNCRPPVSRPMNHLVRANVIYAVPNVVPVNTFGKLQTESGGLIEVDGPWPADKRDKLEVTR